jgi:uncharacterized protein YegP (UPF0339 family)
MAASFELYLDGDGCHRFRLVAVDGSVMLTSEAYVHEDAAIAGIWAVREVAVTGSIVDLTGSTPMPEDNPALMGRLDPAGRAVPGLPGSFGSPEVGGWPSGVPGGRPGSPLGRSRWPTATTHYEGRHD